MDLLLMGQKIRDRRKEKNISQQELAEAAGYTQKGMISQIEAGKVNLHMDKVILIADYLEMPVSELLGEEKKKDPFDGLTQDQIERVNQYIDLIRSAGKWQQQNGTEKDGGSESGGMAR